MKTDVYMDVGHLLLLLPQLLWSSGRTEGHKTGLWAEGSHSSTEHVRLVGGASRCAGELQVNQGEWRPVDWNSCNLKIASVVCRELDCGSVISIARRKSSFTPRW
ncbi:hypothetical protein INR49_030310, partial [Caranx melampygus]